MEPERLEQIEELYHSASERSPDLREAFLAEACRNDPGLLRDVRALLAQDPSADPMERPVLQFAASLLGESLNALWRPGAQVGPYQIVSRLGKGGMGDVYRARDTRLDREVAIKSAHEEFSGRFQQEARAISALNHPHICTLYDVGPSYLVMELVEGPTLADRIQQGALPMEEALEIAYQIADALDAAHQRGIIHRDLKPANIKIKPDGSVKVLDFGLAKVNRKAPLPGEDARAPKEAATESGTVMGTAAYMPPEQARGMEVDKRADIWSFGCVLYEMLSGGRAFQGGSTTDVLAAVVRAEPDWSALPAATPAPVRRLLKRCLEKDRKRRLPDIGVARLEINDAKAPPEQPVAAPKRRSVFPWIVAGTAALLIAGAAIWQADRAPAQEAWSGVLLGGAASAYEPRLSPDGQLLAFLAFVDQLPQLAVMRPDVSSASVLTSDREHGYITTAAWAPDGSKIYFDRMWGHPLGIYFIPPLGGEPRLLLDDAWAPEALPDGSLIVAKLTGRGDNQLFQYWPESGKLDALPAFLPQADWTQMLRAFPDGKELVYYGTYGTSEKERSQSARLLVFDLASRRARDLSPGVRLDPGDGWAPLDVAPGGESVYLGLQEGDTRRLVEVPRKPGGKPRVLLSFPISAVPLAVDAAPDGSLYLDLLRTANVMLRIPAVGGAGEEFALPNTDNFTMVAPGGEMLLTLKGWGRQYVAAVRPGSQPRRLVETPEDTALPATIFGGKVAFVIGSGDQRRIAIAALRDGRVVRRFSMRSDYGMAASPDGNTLYYAFSSTIWAQPVGGGNPQQITEGIDVTLDPKGEYLYVKRVRNGAMGIVRIPVAGGDAEELPVAAEYHVAYPGLSPAAVDARGRILVPVNSAHSFYYQTAILDPAAKSFTLLPMAIDGDAGPAGWAPDGRILVRGKRYLSSLWRYQRSKGLR